MLRNKIKAQSKQQEHKNAGGRTMMEMLGTLAIIGVLSIGGIAGYNYAMDKYRANTTINDINLRAIDLITQSGRDLPLSLSEWSQTSAMGYTFSDPEWAADGSIALKISGLPERVCEMVVDTLDNRFDIEVGATRYTGDNSICGENNAVTVFFEKTGAGITCNPACGDGEVCDNGICVDEEIQWVTPAALSCSTNAECPECWACSNGACSDSTTLNNTACGMNGSGTCQNGVCQANSCSNGEACGSGFFCKDSNSNSSCESRAPTQCRSLNGYFARKTITLSDNTTETWYVSNVPNGAVTWWDAEAACTAAGLTMVTVNELVSGWSSPSTGTFTRTERAQKLKDAIGNKYVWTSDDHGSCGAFLVDLSNGSVSSYFRNGNYFEALALCHGSISYSPSGGNPSSGILEVSTGY